MNDLGPLRKCTRKGQETAVNVEIFLLYQRIASALANRLEAVFLACIHRKETWIFGRLAQAKRTTLCSLLSLCFFLPILPPDPPCGGKILPILWEGNDGVVP
ncbi:hypothetical protein IE53DRAFT_52590 [Violaceomyces palustris]|uniref:Uncharacterized protein n=1 Tax=Violaceomyces palustris TaxID=1673888 RepID=A0ACD0P026_9BASI|nr:hypothetical protein IE53DRAFT_52590 [Violaceomyces palustris]